MLLLRRLIILILAATCAVSFAAGKKRDRRLSEYVLTFDQFNNMDLPERVEYIKFLGQFLAAIEDAQKPPVEKKKSAQMMQQFFELAISRAYAEGEYKALGATCIHSFAVSEYVQSTKSKNTLVCKEPVTSSQCGSGQTGCGDQLYKIAKLIPGKQGLKGLCVPSEYKHRTANCWKELNKVGGKYLDQAIADHIGEMYQTETEKKQFAEFSTQAKATLEEFQNQSMNGGLSIREYCQLSGKERGKNTLNGGLQDEECQSIMQAVDKFAPATGLPEKITVDPSQVEPAAADVGGRKNTEPESDVQSDSETDRDKNTTVIYKRQANAKAEAPPREQNAEPDTQPDTTPQSAEPTPDEPAGKGEAVAKTLGPLECVAKGLAKELGSSASSYSNWVALMGVIVQKQSGNDRYTSQGDAAAFQSKVIDAIGSFGYCRDVTYPIDVASNGAINDWITGKKAPTDEGIAKAFGITSKYSKNAIDDLFQLDPSTTVVDRNSNFKSKAGAYASRYGQTPFSKCAGKMADLKDMRFNFICNKATHTYSKTANQRNTAFRNGLAAACEGVGGFKAPPPQACESGDEEEPVIDTSGYDEPAPDTKPARKKTVNAPVTTKKTTTKINWKSGSGSTRKCKYASSYWACKKVNRGKNCWCENEGGGKGRDKTRNPPSEKTERESNRTKGENTENDSGRGANGGKDGGIR